MTHCAVVVCDAVDWDELNLVYYDQISHVLIVGSSTAFSRLIRLIRRVCPPIILRASWLTGKNGSPIRLSGIDCPEKRQAYGQKAKHAASDLAFGKEVTIQTHGHDKYTRTIGDVILPDGMNLNQELVKQGWCWWYRKYAPRDTVLEGLERDAREGRKGLWADPQPVPPWEYRRSRRTRNPMR